MKICSLFLTLFLACTIPAFAQYADCVPDSNVTDPESDGQIHPTHFPPAYIGEQYSQVITFTPPPEQQGYDLAKLQLFEFVSFPEGMNWETNTGVPEDYMYPLEWYCIVFNGAPTGPAGVFDVELYVNVWIFFYTIEIEAPDNPYFGDHFEFIVCNPLNVDLGDDLVMDLQESIFIDASIPGDYASYYWSSGESTAEIEIDGSALGLGLHEYIVYVSDSTGTTGIYQGETPPCTRADTILVNVLDCSSVNPDLGDDIVVCQGAPIELNPGNFSSYLWNNQTTDQVLSVTEQGTYFVLVGDGLGCFKTDTIEVSFNPLPVPDLGDDLDLCLGDSFILNPGDFDSYFWSDESESATLEVYDSGTYYVDVENEFNCTASDTISVVFHQLPEPDLGPDIEACLGNEIDLSPTNEFAEYEWNDLSTTGFLTVTESGEYILIVRDEYNCEWADTVVVNFNDLPEMFDVTGGGWLIDEELLNVGLSGSELNTNYTLFVDGSELISVEGTGSELSFGLYGTVGVYTAIGINEFECFSDMNGSVEIFYGNSNFSAISSLGIYPNPTKDYVIIQSEFPIDEVKIIDMNGKEFYSIQSRNGTYNVSQLDAGSYLLRIYCNGQIIEKQLVIE
jgi:hypothetical protein